MPVTFCACIVFPVSDSLATLSVEKAQALANFALLVPKQLPQDCRWDERTGSFRPEGPPEKNGESEWSSAQTASYIYAIEGKERAIRCKEFLYDLGPLSTLDHAALYDHYAWKMRVVPLDAHRVCWLGVDYAKKRAATFFAWGTNVELRVTKGEFTDAELVDIVRAMEPLSKEVLKKPFARLSYWSRYPRYDLNMCRTDYRPPSSLWRLRWPWVKGAHRWSVEPPSWKAPSGWRFDSRCTLGSAEDQALYFPEDGNRHAQLWIRRIKSSESPLKKPGPSRLPQIDSFSGVSTFRIRVAEGTYIASVTDEYGPHDGVWWEKEDQFLVHASASADNSIESFLGLLAKFRGISLTIENGNVF